MTKGPVLFDVDEPASETPAEAPMVVDLPGEPPTGQAMQTVAQLAAHKPSRLARWFWGVLLALVGAVVSIAAWDFVTGLLARNPVLGWGVAALIAILGLIALIVIIRELAAFARLARMDRLHVMSEDALANQDLSQARAVMTRLKRLYRGRSDVQWGLNRLAETEADQLDADALLGLAETTVLAPLDAAALREVEAAARQVATVTTLVPLALADVVTALTANVRMIRRIAEVYGGRSGALGSWRLTRAVLTHLVATGAVAVGDDLIGSVAGGNILGKISRRFGEGIINGALTARVGVAAMEVCRPLPFVQTKRPSVTSLVRRAFTGLFLKDRTDTDA